MTDNMDDNETNPRLRVTSTKITHGMQTSGSWIVLYCTLQCERIYRVKTITQRLQYLLEEINFIAWLQYTLCSGVFCFLASSMSGSIWDSRRLRFSTTHVNDATCPICVSEKLQDIHYRQNLLSDFYAWTLNQYLQYIPCSFLFNFLAPRQQQTYAINKHVLKTYQQSTVSLSYSESLWCSAVY